MQQTPDKEIHEFIISLFYNGGNYQHLNKPHIISEVNEKFPSVHTWDISRLIKQLRDDDLISYPDPGTGLMRLTNGGLASLKPHGGSYIKYAAAFEKRASKKERRERIDRNIRNGNIVAASLISLMALILTQCPTYKDRQQNLIKTDLQQLQLDIDSIKRDIRNTPTMPPRSAALDTATNK